jgi:MFS family permease
MSIKDKKEISENPEAIEQRKKKARENSLKDAVFVNGTAGFGDSYISAYAIALGASPTEIGFLTSLSNLVGPLSQIFTSHLMLKTSRKKIFSISILLQSLMWIPIILLPFLFLREIKCTPLLLVICYTIYTAFGNFAAPAWSSWIGDLVPKKEIGRFFGKRNSLGSISALISMVLAGLILDFSRKIPVLKKEQTVFLGFVIIFFLAMICRFLSRHFVLKQYEPEFRFQKANYFSFLKFVKSAPKRNFGKFSISIALILLATNIAAPFYAIYMLKDLEFSYFQFMLINVFAAIATFLFMPLWGKFADDYGNVNTLRITSLMVPIGCFLWPLSLFLDHPLQFYFLLLTSFFAGFAWAGFNLAAGNFLYDATTAEKRSLCVAYSNILNGLGIVIGASLGSFLISRLKVSFMNIIMFVSLISGVARYIVSYLIIPKVKEVRVIEARPGWKAIPLFSQILVLPVYIQNIFPLKTIAIHRWRIVRRLRVWKKKK